MAKQGHPCATDSAKVLESANLLVGVTAASHISQIQEHLVGELIQVADEAIQQMEEHSSKIRELILQLKKLQPDCPTASAVLIYATREGRDVYRFRVRMQPGEPWRLSVVSDTEGTQALYLTILKGQGIMRMRDLNLLLYPHLSTAVKRSDVDGELYRERDQGAIHETLFADPSAPVRLKKACQRVRDMFCREAVKRDDTQLEAWIRGKLKISRAGVTFLLAPSQMLAE